MKIRLQVGISTAFTLITVVIVVVSATIMYESNRDLAFETAESRMASARENTVANLINIVDPVGNMVARTADLAGQFPDNTISSTGAGLLAAQIAGLPQVYSIYIAYEERGDFYQVVRLPESMTTFGSTDNKIPDGAKLVHRRIIDHGRMRNERQAFHAEWGNVIGRGDGDAQYDPRVRSWYRGAFENDQSYVSDIYRFQSTGELGITFARRIEDPRGNVVGVVGADITMTQMIDVLKSIRIGEDGRVFLLNQDDSLIGYVGSRRQADQIEFATDERTSIEDITESIVSKAIMNWMESRQDYFSFDADGHSYLVSAATIPEVFGARPTLGFVVPADYFVGSIKETTAFVLQISVVILVFAVGMIFWISHLIGQQLAQATREADRIGQMDLSEDFSMRSVIHEVDSLGAALGNMRTALQTFLKYAPRDLVTEIVRSGKPARIGGSRQEVTLMFTDIAGFTTMSEKMSPEDVMSFMSIYFELLTDAISKYNGIVDKFIGDAIMAMWNAPIANPNHVPDACDAALVACRASVELNEELMANNFPALKTRFGLHCCDALVGNVGAPDRVQFTSLGAGVNLAPRIEGLNKFYKTQILVSDTVRKKAGPRFLFRRVDLVTAKGTSRPVTVFELLGEQDEQGAFYVGADIVKQAVKYEQAFDFYLHRDFGDALSVLAELREENPDDFVVESLFDKCEAYKLNPPPSDWNGSTALDEK